MHPDPAFRDDDAALDRVAAIGFAHIAVVTPAGLMMIHVPVTRHGGDLRFHVARRNRACPHLDGAAALLSVSPLNGYISPNWYADPGDQVPTWNYVSIEVEGTVRRLDEEDLVDQLDRLAALHEPRVNPAAPWTRAKMNDARFRAMLRGIAGYELHPIAIRGTRKLSQNKSAADRTGVIGGLLASGNTALAAAMDEIATAAPSHAELPPPRT